MNHKDMVNAIQFIRPNAEFILAGDELQWLDKTQSEPTKAEIAKGWEDYKKSIELQAQQTATAKAAILERLGITEEEAALLLG